MNIDQYRAVTKSEIDPLDHPDHPIIDKGNLLIIIQ